MKKYFLVSFLMIITFYSYAQEQIIIPVTEDQVFNAFKQDIVKFDGFWSKFGGGGNCASIALVKAAIGTFGINGVFKNVSTDENSKIVTVTLRNGKIRKIHFDRLKHGKSRFYINKIGDDALSKEIAEYARFCFAVMVRSKQLQMGNDSKYWYKACDNLNKGEAAIDIYKLLGLQKETINDLSVDNLKNTKNLVLWIAPHAVYSSSANYDEFFRGTATGIEPLSKIKDFHCKTCSILGAYSLK